MVTYQERERVVPCQKNILNARCIITQPAEIMTTPSSARLLGKTRSVLKRDQSRGQKSRKSGSSIRQEFGLWTENEELIESCRIP
jgi:hypothetical protein